MLNDQVERRAANGWRAAVESENSGLIDAGGSVGAWVVGLIDIGERHKKEQRFEYFK